jgi:dTDP-4-amino-4,6-dideoxygalactose transaminase
MVRRFEESFAALTGLHAVAVCNGGAALRALYAHAGVGGGEVIVPANTFWATAVEAKHAGATVIYADCNRGDLCLSLDDLRRRVTPRTRAVTVTHIGGHIAFQIAEIAAFCQERGIALIEDCAHAHGAAWHGKSAGSWGIGGAYSFYATKTLPLGEGGMVVTRDPALADRLRHYRNYGKHVEAGKVTYRMTTGTNCRMNEVTAALGVVQMERLPMILEWKRALAAKLDQVFERRVRFPAGMVSGYYKYIVFDYALREETGKVFNRTDFGTAIEGVAADLPNSDWIADHHRCVPIWFGWPDADESVADLRARLLPEA